MPAIALNLLLLCCHKFFIVESQFTDKQLLQAARTGTLWVCFQGRCQKRACGLMVSQITPVTSRRKR